MDRRELLKMIAVLSGGAVAGSELFLSGCTTAGKADIGFTAENIALLDEVGETILPATSSPGAKAAHIGEFMRLFVTDCYDPQQQEVFIKGMSELNTFSKKQNGNSFLDASAQQRHDLLLKLEDEARIYNDTIKAGQGKKAGPLHYYTMIKQLTLLGFFTSETGCTQALRHERAPGRYDGDLPYKKGDRAWAE